HRVPPSCARSNGHTSPGCLPNRERTLCCTHLEMHTDCLAAVASFSPPFLETTAPRIGAKAEDQAERFQQKYLPTRRLATPYRPSSTRAVWRRRCRHKSARFEDLPWPCPMSPSAGC